jgi:hypothetical protein
MTHWWQGRSQTYGKASRQGLATARPLRGPQTYGKASRQCLATARPLRGQKTYGTASRQGLATARPLRYGKASRIALILPLVKSVALTNSLRGLAQQRKASSLLRRGRGRAPRGKLRRRNHCCSPLTPLLQLWEPFLLRTGAGLGRLAGRSC